MGLNHTLTGHEPPSFYNAWTPLAPPDFVGRDRELMKVCQAVQDCRSVSVVADHHLGKSSFLKTLKILYQTQGRNVRYLSGLDTAGQSVQAFVSVITGRDSPTQPDQAADHLAAWAAEQAQIAPPLLLVDDVESCFQRFPLRFFERLRGMLYKLVLIFASSQELDLIGEDEHRANVVSPLENRLEMVRLGLLSNEAAEQLIQRGAGVFSEADQALMRQWAGRHPYYLQLVGAALWRARLRGESRQELLDHLYAEARLRLRQIWLSLHPGEQQALLGALRGQVITHRSLRLRGLVTEEGQLFGQILREWLEQEQ